MNFRRRGVLLVEMLTVIVMVSAGGTLMAVALASMLKSQDRVALLSNRFAMTNDFINCIQDDVRSGAAMQLQTLSPGDSDQLQVLTIAGAAGPVSYRFFKERVERDAGPSGRSAKSWGALVAVATVEETNATEGAGVNVTVHWRRSGHDDPEPNRRFDFFVRCVGGSHDAEE